MSTSAAPFGLRPIGRLDSGSLEVMRQYPIASGYGTAIAAGDVVKFADGGSATTIEKESGTGDTSTELNIAGIFMGVSYTDPNTSQKYSAHYIQQAHLLRILWPMLLMTRMFCLLFRQTVRHQTQGMFTPKLCASANCTEYYFEDFA